VVLTVALNLGLLNNRRLIDRLMLSGQTDNEQHMRQKSDDLRLGWTELYSATVTGYFAFTTLRQTMHRFILATT